MKTIKISEDELLILSEWLNQFISSNEFDSLENPIKRVLTDLDCNLEKENEYLFSENYENKILEAKDKIKF